MAKRHTAAAMLKIALLLLLIILTITAGRNTRPAFADNPTSNNVLKELQSDTNFTTEDYPSKADDYGIYVIQVAESASGSLYVYTYQPCQTTRYLVATDVNMTLNNPNADGTPAGGADINGTQLYSLTLVNCNQVFCKYRVNGVTVIAAETRYYNITSIYRPWDKEIDGVTGNNNTLDKKAYNVGKDYTATTENGEVKYACAPVKTVEIKNPYVDYLLYIENMSLPSVPTRPWLPSSEKGAFIDSHYVAFSTDWEIDSLMSATVYYEYRTAHGIGNTFLGFDCGGDLTYGERRKDYAYPTYKDKAEYTGSFWNNGLNYSYSWDRIQTVAEFTDTEKLTETTKQNLAGKEWVLRFTETQRTQDEIEVLGYKKYDCNWTVVDRVTVLRLEFETGGITYNLGAVSDMQSGDSLPGNAEPGTEKSFWDKVREFFENLFKNIAAVPWWVWLIIVLIALAILLPILSIFFPVVRLILKNAINVLIWLLKAVLWIITLPFRGIAWLFGKRKPPASTPVNKK